MPRPSKNKGSPSGNILENIVRDIRALNASQLILAQKLKHIIRNEKILGRNLLVLNKKLKKMEEGGLGVSAGGEASEETLTKLDEIQSGLSKLGERLSNLENELEKVKQTYAKSELVQEMKYVVDTINPLEFVTYRDIDRLINEKLGKKAETR